jgi:hypothetical protein
MIFSAENYSTLSTITPIIQSAVGTLLLVLFRFVFYSEQKLLEDVNYILQVMPEKLSPNFKLVIDSSIEIGMPQDEIFQARSCSFFRKLILFNTIMNKTKKLGVYVKWIMNFYLLNMILGFFGLVVSVIFSEIEILRVVFIVSLVLFVLLVLAAIVHRIIQNKIICLRQAVIEFV